MVFTLEVNTKQTITTGTLRQMATTHAPHPHPGSTIFDVHPGQQTTGRLWIHLKEQESMACSVFPCCGKRHDQKQLGRGNGLG